MRLGAIVNSEGEVFEGSFSMHVWGVGHISGIGYYRLEKLASGGITDG